MLSVFVQPAYFSTVRPDPNGELMDRMATHLENLEKSGNLRVVREKSGKMSSCMWSITASIVLDTRKCKKGATK